MFAFSIVPRLEKRLVESTSASYLATYLSTYLLLRIDVSVIGVLINPTFEVDCTKKPACPMCPRARKH